MDAVAQVQLVVRLTLGLIFAVSAVAKLRAPAAFVRGVVAYAIIPPPLARLYGWTLPFVELATALLLLSGFALIFGSGLATVMLTSFAAAIAVFSIQGRQLNCNCFGAGSHAGGGWPALVRDLFLLAAAGWLLTVLVVGRGPVARWPQADPELATATVIVAVVLALTFVLLDQGLDVLLTWAGSPGGTSERRY